MNIDMAFIQRPCITEVLNSIDIVAHGQFGNWCIQHICEHGAPADRSRATDHVLRYATEYSMDQFASKVVEKCLKIGGHDFMERYLERVCEGRADRPRIPLIDSTLFGERQSRCTNGKFSCERPIWQLSHPIHPYARQSQPSRDCGIPYPVGLPAKHIEGRQTRADLLCSKHMVSLRGSKFGSRVGMLCCNPAYATHPGPVIGLPSTRSYSAQSNAPRYGGTYR